MTLVFATGAEIAGNDDVNITMERNTGADATGAFRFKQVPAPSKTDAATNAKVELIVGRRDSNGAPLAALVDGLLPSGQDEPTSNFFYATGTDGGRFRLDLGSPLEISEINTYSWHASSRGPQVYNLYISDGTEANFNPAPDAKTHPAHVGWKLLAAVDTRPKEGGRMGGQYGVNIRGKAGSLGKFRYLLFDAVEAEYTDPFGNTFFSEIDVVAKQ
ncbi:MAG TPA: hypothetical protein VM009_07775 [Terriglobales bacterium]|nr:hypothetical protein [Terriglobales bacterium]